MMSEEEIRELRAAYEWATQYYLANGDQDGTISYNAARSTLNSVLGDDDDESKQTTAAILKGFRVCKHLLT